MSKVCNDCVNDEKYCSICTRNPNNPVYSNYYKPYNLTCKYRHSDCIHDPAYIYHYDKDWYFELYGTMTPEEAAVSKDGCGYCQHGEHYDWEDK